MRSCIIASLFACALLSACSFHSDYVFQNDTDQKFDEKAIMLSQRIGRIKQSIDYGVLLLKDIPESEDIKLYSARKLTDLGLGKKTNSRAILIVLNESKPEVKIEVSYALEAILPDALVNRIEKAASTYLIHGNRADFITEFIIRTGLLLKKKFTQEQLLEFFDSKEHFGLSRHISGGAGVQNVIKEVSELVQKLDNEDKSRFVASESAAETLRNYIQSLERGIGDPDLPLLTEGSKLYRLEFPKSRGQILALASDFNRASPYDLQIGDRIAYAFFEPTEPVLPIVLVKNQEKWFVDEVKSWAYFQRFEDSSTYFRKYANYPGKELWDRSHKKLQRKSIYGNKYQPRKLAPPHLSLVQMLEAATSDSASSSTSTNQRMLGDIFYFEIYWIERAIQHYESSLKGAPKNSGLRWHLSNLYLMNSQIDKYVSQIRKAACLTPIEETYLQNMRQFHESIYDFSSDSWEEKLKPSPKREIWNIFELFWFYYISCNFFTDLNSI